MNQQNPEEVSAANARKVVYARSLLSNFLLALFSVFLVVSLLELIVPRAIEVTDQVEYESLPMVGLRLRPNQEGWYIRDHVGGGAAIRAPFKVNGQGFNNPRNYDASKRKRYRIAVVGDSFVEAFQVPFEEAFFKVLEESLASSGVDAEVFSFGVSGFGTSQIYHLIQNYVLTYQPDFLVYLFIPNNVSDSAVCKGRKQWTQQYTARDGSEPVPAPFQTYKLRWTRSALQESALVRYLMYQRRLKERLIVWKKKRRQKSPSATPGLDSCSEEAWRIVDFLLGRVDALLREESIPWLLTWQGDTEPSFYMTTRLRLEEIAEDRDLPYLDLTSAFERDFRQRREPVRITGDGHWNAIGHEVAGKALAEELVRMLDLQTLDSASQPSL